MKEFYLPSPAGRVLVSQSGESGSTVLFLHGNSLSSRIFFPLFTSPLASRHRFIAFDLPGHGGSEWAARPEEGYTLASYVEAIRAVVSAIAREGPVRRESGAPEQPALVGHSLGGHLVLQAIARGLPASGVFLCGTPPLKDLSSMAEAFLPHPLLQHFFQAEITVDRAKEMASVVTGGRSDLVPLLTEEVLRTDPLARSTLAASLPREFNDETEVLRTAFFPVWVGVGDRDPFVNQGYVRRLEKTGSGKVRLVLFSGCSHCPPLEDPSAFEGALSNFLGEVMGRPEPA